MTNKDFACEKTEKGKLRCMVQKANAEEEEERELMHPERLCHRQKVHTGARE